MATLGVVRQIRGLDGEILDVSTLDDRWGGCVDHRDSGAKTVRDVEAANEADVPAAPDKREGDHVVHGAMVGVGGRPVSIRGARS